MFISLHFGYNEIKRQIKKKVEETFGCHSSDLSRSSSLSSAGARPAPTQAPFCCVHIICMHFSLGDEASLSLKPRPAFPSQNPAGPGCHESIPAVAMVAPDGGAPPFQRNHMTTGRTERCIGRKANSFCAGKTKENAKEGKKNLREDK